MVGGLAGVGVPSQKGFRPHVPPLSQKGIDKRTVQRQQSCREGSKFYGQPLTVGPSTGILAKAYRPPAEN